MKKALGLTLFATATLLASCADSGSSGSSVKPLTSPPIADGVYSPSSLLYQFDYDGQQYNVTYQQDSGGTYQLDLSWQGDGVYRSEETGASSFSSGSSNFTVDCTNPHIAELTIGDDNCEMQDRSTVIQAGCGGGSSATPESVCFSYSGGGFTQTNTYSDAYASDVLGAGSSNLKIITNFQP